MKDISGELIALITFPGVILHEISHRFFCDLFNVPVTRVKYFGLSDKNVGFVGYLATESFYKEFFISIAPLIINSLICIILTFPISFQYYLGTNFVNILGLDGRLIWVLTWVGYSAGYNAIPSDQDMNNLFILPKSKFSLIIISWFLKVIIAIFNIDFIGPILKGFFAYGISLLGPILYFSIFS